VLLAPQSELTAGGGLSPSILTETVPVPVDP
jgi:hypothetical protein